MKQLSQAMTSEQWHLKWRFQVCFVRRQQPKRSQDEFDWDSMDIDEPLKPAIHCAFTKDVQTQPTCTCSELVARPASSARAAPCQLGIVLRMV